MRRLIACSTMIGLAASGAIASSIAPAAASTAGPSAVLAAVNAAVTGTAPSTAPGTAPSTGAGPATGSSVATAGAARAVPTSFALETFGYGSRVRGGQVPAGSGSTAYQVIGCTNNAGVSRENHEAQEALPGIGTASQVATRTWTTTNDSGVVTSHSRSTIARIVLADSPLGSLEINGIKSVSKAWHDAAGFHADTSSAIGSITLTPPGGEPQEQALPTPDQPLDIPGLVTITVGNPRKAVDANGAVARNEVIRIDSAASGSKARIGHTYAEISGGIKHGIFGGFSSGSRINAADGSVTSGRTPYQPLPCQGTDGQVQTRSIAGANLGDQVVVGAENAKQMAKQTADKAWGYEQGSVASIDIGGGQLHVDGIIGRVNVLRQGGSFNAVSADIKGTTVGTITANGQEYSFPDTDALKIPGVAVLRRNITDPIRGGLQVTALRITLLEGSQAGTVINLGQAKLRILKSGL